MGFATDHFNAMLTRARQHPALANKTTDTVLLSDDGAYVHANYLLLLGGRPDDLGGARQARKQILEDDALFEYTAEAVGISPQAVRDLLDAAAEQFIGWVPVLPGRRCDPLRYHPGDAAPQPVADVKPPLYHGRDQYTLRSRFVNAGA